MYTKTKKSCSYIYLILIAVSIVGIFYTDDSSTGGGFYPNLGFIIIGLIFTVYFIKNFIKDSTNKVLTVLILNPLSILLLNGYQMFNIFPIILLILIFIKGSLKKNKLNINFFNDINFILVFYLYCLISIMLTIMNIYPNIENTIYWFLIIISNISLIGALIFTDIDLNKINYKNIINSIYYIFIIISLSCIGRIVLTGINQGDISMVLKYKRLFAYPTMSTSNYTIAVLSILMLYLICNKEYLNNNKKIFMYSIMFLNIMVTQSRGSVLAWMFIGITFMFKNVKFLNLRINVIEISFKKVLYVIICIIIALVFIIIGININTDKSIISEINILQRIKSTFTGLDSNVSSRIYYWKIYLNDIYNFDIINIFLGKGLSNQLGLVRRPHNLYILLLNQVGIIGLSIFIYGLYKITKKYKTIKFIVLYLLVHSIIEPLLLTIWIDNILIIFVLLEGLGMYKLYNK